MIWFIWEFGAKNYATINKLLKIQKILSWHGKLEIMFMDFKVAFKNFEWEPF